MRSRKTAVRLIVFAVLAVGLWFLSRAVQSPLLKAFAMAFAVLFVESLLVLLLSLAHPADNRAKTLVTITISVLRYVAAVVILCWGLTILGVDVTTVVASVGIVALVVGFGAESLIEDVVTGTFMLFENQYNVGDIVEIDGFRGVVKEIGIRTTSIEDVGKNVKIINNSQMRSLLGLSKEVSGLEISLDGKADRRTLGRLQELLGPDFLVRDRARQNPDLYRMMRYEKLAVYLILLFVVIIIATNILGSLSMLVIEKEDDIRTLRALGADDLLIRRIFIWEGWLVSLSGLLAGLVIGIALALLQQRFGIVKMPGGFLLQAYPVVLQAGDVLWTALGVAAIGILISSLAAARSKATGGV